MAVAAAFFSLLLTFAAPSAYACSVCFGDPESPQTAGMNAAIATMLGVTLVVLAGAGMFGAAAVWRYAHDTPSTSGGEEDGRD